MTEAILFRDLRVRNDKEPLDRDFFDRRNKILVDVINNIATDVASLKVTQETLVELGLTRINDLLGPALETLNAASELGFLLATSESNVTLTVGQTITLEIDEGANRDLFTPTPFLSIMRTSPGAEDDWAIARLDTYNKTNGGLSVTILSVNGAVSSGNHNDWIIAASSGIVPVIAQKVTDAQAILDEANALLSDLEDIAALIENGPVSSVNGHVGTVVLGMADIADLVSTLGGKAASLHGHAMADITGLVSALAGKSDTSHNHNGVYSLVSHNHDAAYAALGHNHNGVYATASHNHDAAYAALGHNHDAAYAALGHNHDATYAKLANPKFTSRIRETVVAAGSSTLDLSAGNIFTRTVSGGATFAFSNAPASGDGYAFSLIVDHVSGSITWPASVKWPSNTAPTLSTSKKHIFTFLTIDGGTTWRGGAVVDYAS